MRSPNPFTVIQQFEKALCEYTGAPYAVAVNSCTMALLLSLAYYRKHFLVGTEIVIPKKTYVSVPQAAIHAGFDIIQWSDKLWHGSYELPPTTVIDSARRFTAHMYEPTTFCCVSFHATKILADTQGGAILHNDTHADEWFRRARFDGRAEGVHPKDDKNLIVGWHCYMSPDVAARLLHKLSILPESNAPLPNDEYPDLSQIEAFKAYTL